MEIAIFILSVVGFILFCSMLCQRDEKHAAQARESVLRQQLRDKKRKLEYVISCFGDDGVRSAKHWDEVVNKADLS